MGIKCNFVDIINEIRIKSWVKNVFVVLPLVFSLELFQIGKLFALALLVLAFGLVSSAIYIFNDIIDVERDKLHETKKHRPIASGQMPVSFAITLLLILIVSGCTIACFVNVKSLLLILAYIVINVLYTKWLKHVVIIDCFCIASGFVLRVLVGGTIVSDGVSQWMFLTVVAVSLFMAFGKRRGELAHYREGNTRSVLEQYDISFLDGIIYMCAGLAVMFYSLWAMNHIVELVYTVPLIIIIVVRYLYLAFRGKGDADPTTLILSDAMLLLLCGICGVLMIILLYRNVI